MNPESETMIITDLDAGERLDRFLTARYLQTHSRSYFQWLIAQQHVLLNGKPAKKRIKLESGDEVEVLFVMTPEIDLEPESIPLDILFEDEHLIVVNKPSGMVVHPAVGNWSGTFVNALLYHCKTLPEGEYLRPGIVHRLDKETSGVLIAAKTMQAQQKLIEMFSGREIHKEYLAICLGKPGEGTIQASIGRHPVHRQKMTIREDGKHAVSHYQTVKFDESLSVVEIVLETGRTHQIRVHMKHLGTPILGDVLYGNPSVNQKYRCERQMLHAWRVRFNHPIFGKQIEIEAPPPEDMNQILKLFGNNES